MSFLVAEEITLVRSVLRRRSAEELNWLAEGSGPRLF
jgi:hypothetical protein